MDEKIFSKIKIGLILIVLNQIFPMKLSEFHNVIMYDKKKLLKITEITTFPNYRIVSKLSHSFQTIKDIYSKSKSTNWKLYSRLCLNFMSLS